MDEDIKTKCLELFFKMLSLIFASFLFGVGTLSALYAKLGMSPWDVFHMGIVYHSPFTLGQISILTGVLVLLISYFIGVIPGVGSILNMTFSGIFTDAINRLGVFRTPHSMAGRLLMLIFAIFIMGWATFLYLRVELGAGPRDGLMEGLVKKLNKPVWAVRSTIEIFVLLIGCFLGGPVGIGTIITTFGMGFSIQLAFKIGKYDSKSVQHLNILDTISYLRKVSKKITFTSSSLK